MKDKYKEISKVYSQTTTKKILLIPAIRKAIPSKKRLTGKLLDIGCGTGYFCQISYNRGYKYYGLDISISMLEKAKTNSPKGKYHQLSAISFAHEYKDKFDVVLINLVLGLFEKKSDILKILKETRKVLKKKGLVILGLIHPNFDHYMRRGLLGKKNVKTKFEGYFRSGQRYSLIYKFDGDNVTFKSHHWTIQDYFNLIIKAGFTINAFNECPPSRMKNVSKSKLKEKNKYPTYLVISAQK